MNQSKYWLPKTILILLLISFGFYFLNKELTAGSDQPGNQSTKVLAEFTTTTPLVPIFQPTIPIVSKNDSETKVEDYSINLPVLMYHYVRSGVSPVDELGYTLSVSPENLEAQLAYLSEQNFQTISFAELAESLEQGTPLPQKSIILTFDDGYRDFYTTVFPLLKKYNLRAVSFYVAGYSNYPGYMTWEMAREVQNSGLVDVQSHTLSHLMLTKLSSEQMRSEIFDSKKLIEQMLGKKVNAFAYPYGDLNEQVVGLVSEAGYKLAFGTQPGPLLKTSEKLSLRRVTVSGFDDLDKFIEKLGQPVVEVIPSELPEPQDSTSSATTSAIEE